ncbi:MAG: Gfo/Idh/MocA family oxidoreductase [Deltaproteobacteria bacterium]|nr:Gfo/Idh/MocA family oxidoreductase [Deltaproteobacteria bacterium]
MQLAACIIGLGQVGLRFDLEKERAQSPGDIWTHFTAYERLADRFKLVAAVDPNEQAWAPALARNPALKCFKSIAELLGSGLRVDVASICTPDAFHLEHFEALQSRVSGIFLEKPVCLSVELARARTLVAEARARGLALYVRRGLQRASGGARRRLGFAHLHRKTPRAALRARARHRPVALRAERKPHPLRALRARAQRALPGLSRVQARRRERARDQPEPFRLLSRAPPPRALREKAQLCQPRRRARDAGPPRPDRPVGGAPLNRPENLSFC